MVDFFHFIFNPPRTTFPDMMVLKINLTLVLFLKKCLHWEYFRKNCWANYFFWFLYISNRKEKIWQNSSILICRFAFLASVRSPMQMRVALVAPEPLKRLE
jgi:hypothetical protein